MEKLLALCARDRGCEVMYVQLQEALDLFCQSDKSWKNLIYQAEKHGIASLVYNHIQQMGCKIPRDAHRLLQSLYLRNSSSNGTRIAAVAEIVRVYQREAIDLLLVKGIALCNSVYSEIGLRPMRDIDLLVRKVDLPRAREILLDLGYREAPNHTIASDYYHLPPMEKIINGLPVAIELHHNLLPLHAQYPLWPLEKSFANAEEVVVAKEKAKTLCLEDTLLYCYLHGFQAPLTYEPYRLIHVADIVTLIEENFSLLDWEKITAEVPKLADSISRFGFLTPWTKPVQTLFNYNEQQVPRGVGAAFGGWPLVKICFSKVANYPKLIKDTLFPSSWWLQVYYGELRGLHYWKVRLFNHPRTIWRWVKSYCRAHFEQKSSF